MCCMNKADFALYLSIFVRRTRRNPFVLLTIFSNLWREKKLGTPSVCENPLTPTCQQKEGITVNSLILRFNDMFACSNITFYTNIFRVKSNLTLFKYNISL